MANSTSAATSTGTRPRRSAIRPMSGSIATYPSRKPDTIGAARCSWSIGTPTAAIMSGQREHHDVGVGRRERHRHRASASSSRARPSTAPATGWLMGR